jgi:hypothetical protein
MGNFKKRIKINAKILFYIKYIIYICTVKIIYSKKHYGRQDIFTNRYPMRTQLLSEFATIETKTSRTEDEKIRLGT